MLTYHCCLNGEFFMVFSIRNVRTERSLDMKPTTLTANYAFDFNVWLASH